MKVIYKKIVICIVVVSLAFGIWKIFLADFLPWTRTIFLSCESYISLLEDNHSFGSVLFAKQKSEGAQDVEYYWHRDFVEMFTAYSVVLNEKDYEAAIVDRMQGYIAVLEDDEEKILYMLQNEEKCYMDESSWVDEERLDYITKVMQKPESKGEYYFLIVVQFNPSEGPSYNGVILNDSTHELIEFSALLRDENG